MVPNAYFLLHEPEKKKNTTRARTCSYSSKKLLLSHGTGKIKSNHLEPHFQTSTTMSRCLERTKTAVALPHRSEST